MGIVLWFTSGAGYEKGRAAIYTCAMTLMWGSFYVIAYIVSLLFGHSRTRQLEKTWHLSEGAVFHLSPFCTVRRSLGGKGVQRPRVQES